MTIEETKTIVDKIRIYRQSFAGYLDTNGVNNLILEWFRVLEPYDYVDVDKKLDEYFKNPDNFGRYPDVYYLTKFLKKHDEKLKDGHYYFKCSNCKEIVDLKNWDSHYERCNSVMYLCEMSQKYFNQKLNQQKLMQAQQDEFEKYYWNFCDKLLDKLPNSQEKHSLKNAILTHNGFKPEFDLENIKISKEVKND